VVCDALRRRKLRRGHRRRPKVNLGAGVGFLGAGKFGFEADFGYSPNFFDASNAINFESKSSNLATVMFNGIVAAPPHMAFPSVRIGRHRVDEEQDR
jgi:hypothetical protein